MARLDYANARLAARRPTLVGAPGLRALLARATLDSRVELLREWPLGGGLPRVLGPDPLGEVEAALREGWRREAAAVLADVEGRRQRRLLEAFLSIDEAAAVKAVLRGVARAAPPERALADAPPVPALKDAALRAAAGAPTLEGALDVLEAGGSTLAGSVREALAAGADGGLLPLELAADRAAFARVRRACRRRGEDAAILRAHVEDRVDARNAATLLALGGTLPAADPFIPGGRRLDEGAFRALVGLAPGPLHAALARAFPELAGAGSPWSSDRALERALLAPLRREARRRPLSLAVPLAYLAERRAEIRRVAILLRGAALGLEGGEILDLAEA